MIFRSAALCILVLISSCSAKVTQTTTNLDLVVPVGGVSYTCASYGSFTDLSTCETTTLAVCNGAVQVFPDATVATCYTPVVGWESCASTPASLEYTGWTNDLSAANTQVRSLIGCSSTTCACLAIQCTECCIAGTTCGVGGVQTFPNCSDVVNCPL